MDDLISRRSAIDAIMCEPTDAHYPSWYAERLKQLPPAQLTDADIQKIQDIEQAMLEKAYDCGKQDAMHWISCKTALPEKRKYVLCQCRAGIMDVLRLTDDNGWYKDSTHIYMHSFVLAWMPLPEPWKGEQE